MGSVPSKCVMDIDEAGFWEINVLGPGAIISDEAGEVLGSLMSYIKEKKSIGGGSNGGQTSNC